MDFYNSHIFNFPQRSILNQKLPKAFFKKHFELSVADKKLMNAIQNMAILANLSPKTVNIPAFSSAEWVYEEIQVIICTLPNNELEKWGKSCIELIQKNIPYPIVLLVEDEHEFILNTCIKKVNQVDKSKRTIADYHTTTPISKLYVKENVEKFYQSLKFSGVDKTNLQYLYDGYTSAIVQYQAAQVTGVFKYRTGQRSMADSEQLKAIEKLETEITSLTNQLKQESQLNGKVTINIAIQRKRNEIKSIKDKLITT